MTDSKDRNNTAFGERNGSGILKDIEAGKIKGAIFDLDGVLIDSMSIWENLGARYLVSIGKEPEEGLGRILFSMSMEQGAEYLVKNYSLTQTADEVIDAIRDTLRDFYYFEVGAKTGAEDLLKGLKARGLKVTAATSSPRGHVEKALERNGLLKYISRIFTNSEVGTSKHTPEIYDAAASSMGTERAETLVFEDSLYALKTAANAGFRAVGVFDANGEVDQKGVEGTGEMYLKELTEFWN